VSGPLDGFRVLDLTAMASGPFATALLAEQGADVIKVEPPGIGDPIRTIGTSRGGISAVFANMNRSKRSLVLNLREPRGVELLLRLADEADVFVQNFRPGVAERMGIGAEVLRARNERLVYVSISGYGETGPYAQRKVYDSVMQAVSGIAAVQADPATGQPAFVRNIVCDKGTALTTAQAITAALLARERGAGGQHLRLSMLDACVAFLWPDGLQNHTFLGDEAGTRRVSGAQTPHIRRTADGFVTFNAIQDAEFAAMCRALGRAELLEDPRFADPAERASNAELLRGLLDEATAGFATEALTARLLAHDVPHAVVNTVDQLLVDPQLAANGLVVEHDHPSAGRLRGPRPVARFEGTPSGPHRPAPLLGEHTDEVLQALQVGDSERARLRADGVIG